jgi:hypothetical protein
MNRSISRIWIHFLRIVALSRILHLLFFATFDSCLLISITLHCASAIAYISVDGCTSIWMMFSFLAFICTICASIDCCSTTLSSFNYSMDTRSTNVALSPICSPIHQLLMLLCKNSIANVLILYILWIIICANYIFSLYVFPLAHSKDDDECDGDLITNG